MNNNSLLSTTTKEKVEWIKMFSKLAKDLGCKWIPIHLKFFKKDGVVKKDLTTIKCYKSPSRSGCPLYFIKECVNSTKGSEDCLRMHS